MPASVPPAGPPAAVETGVEIDIPNRDGYGYAMPYADVYKG